MFVCVCVISKRQRKERELRTEYNAHSVYFPPRLVHSPAPALPTHLIAAIVRYGDVRALCRFGRRWQTHWSLRRGMLRVSDGRMMTKSGGADAVWVGDGPSVRVRLRGLGGHGTI